MKLTAIFILLLLITANLFAQSNDSLGLSPRYPIKVGSGVNGGPSNERIYLNNLVDLQGRQIKIHRKGSCCQYPSKKAPLGVASMDVYLIEFFENEKLSDSLRLFLTYYDYEKPVNAPKGFKFKVDSLSELLEINKANVLKRYAGEKYVNMTFDDLKIVPDYLFYLTDIEELSLAYNDIQSIPPEIKKFEKLKKLEIQSNNIKELPMEISLIDSLEYISLDYRMNWEQVFSVLAKCKNKLTVNFWDAGLNQIPPEIVKCQNIEILILKGNPKIDFEKDFDILAQLTNLKEITISIRNEHFPTGISKLSSLKVLSIEFSDITVIPEEIAFVPNLEELHLRNCGDIKNLPSNIGSAKKLKHVTLSMSDKFNYESALENLSGLELEYLDLSPSWKLHKIPPSVFLFKNLKYLNLNIFETDSIPKEIGNLVNLEEIVLGPSDFKYLPIEFGSLKSLKKIDLSGQVDFDFDQLFSVLSELESLEEIDLTWGEKRLPDSIKNLKSIKRIILKHYPKKLLSPQEIEHLRRLLPNCDFIY